MMCITKTYSSDREDGVNYLKINMIAKVNLHH